MPVRPNLFKEAVTRYQVAQSFKGFAVVHLHPKTGRTHQLRVHMSAIGHPMLGDTFYQSLHALRISFVHPVREQPMTIEAPVPAELQSIVDLLGKHRAF